MPFHLSLEHFSAPWPVGVTHSALRMQTPDQKHWLYKITRLNVASSKEPPLDPSPPVQVMPAPQTTAEKPPSPTPPEHVDVVR